ncbi:hydroperoxide isomerase ALOXE3-like [Hypomesus transpacificus]|uniref:hydroperoxide isomerase ALOXE3-like n=1 Tax=Hypomesus transpacificus TaxID=137520 RepID=UPI001F0876FD|nr:hydroperoxide isomerase ALOXE3-like [Hypomesus transpacificus]
MVIYTAKVFTGDKLSAGTRKRVFLQLVGTKGSSDNVHINKKLVLSQGSVRNIVIESQIDLGELYLIRLRLKKTLFPMNDEWFCSKVTVTTPEIKEVLFPCYNWLSTDEPQSIREATAKLVFEDIREGQMEREKELEKRRGVFQWKVYADGVPECVEADSPLDLPRAVRFSFTKDSQFQLTAGASIARLYLQGFLSSNVPWSGMDEYESIHVEKETDLFEYVKEHWEEDEFFGYQFLNGINPMLIQRCSKLPDNFPVTDDMVKDSFQEQLTLTQEIQNSNIYLADYVRLDDIPANVIDGKQQYMAAPLVLLYKTPDDKLMPIAIQLKQKPGEDNPIFFPTDSKYDWLMAKIFVRSADFVEHELTTHLLRTHLLCEVFAMATLRNLPPIHPLYKLLIPHYRYTFQINIQARNQLISENGIISKNAAIGGEGMNMFLQKAAAALTYSSLCLPEDIAARGLESIPNFYYRDDGQKLWNIIHSYVKGVVEFYYVCDSDVERDSELQKWIGDIFTHGFLEKKETGVPELFSTVLELVKFLTMVIFTASVQHSAVNFGQDDLVGWMPNCPTSLQKPPPTTKGQYTEKKMWETFPDINVTAYGLVTVNLLSTQSPDFVALGCFPNERFVEATPLEKIEELQNNLKVYSYETKARNVDLPLPYTFLYPENIENSVAI